ncbi:hypothetical protein [Streptomyces sp. NPDC006285]
MGLVHRLVVMFGRLGLRAAGEETYDRIAAVQIDGVLFDPADTK